MNDAWAMTTVLYIFAGILTKMSRKHGQTKQFDCTGFGVMEDSFCLFLMLISITVTVIQYFFLGENSSK